MFTFNNTHIFTGYLKQLLSSVNIPTCKIYTHEFLKYYEDHGYEDPRVIESINTVSENRRAIKINYLKNNDLYLYHWADPTNKSSKKPYWVDSSKIVFEGNDQVFGLTRTFKGTGNIYDTRTHHYLGEFLRFLRDYKNIDLMSLYNCFDNKIYNNVYLRIPHQKNPNVTFLEVNSNDPNYKLYAIPVKLFSNYTIAVDSFQGIEMFCGFYGTRIDASERSINLIRKTYKKLSKTNFNRPFLYDCLDVKFWTREADLAVNSLGIPNYLTDNVITRWDIIKKECDLKLFIKVPTSCESSIVILEGDYRSFNDFKYSPVKTQIKGHEEIFWQYNQNTLKSNFQTHPDVFSAENPSTGLAETYIHELPDLNDRPFRPIGKLQLLALNTGESYPFADRLIEYLIGNAITPRSEIADDIKRVQKVMNKNGYSFAIEGIWEPKMQKIIYDYILNKGPFEKGYTTDEQGETKFVVLDKQRGLQPSLGHKRKSSLFDTLGYVDKDVEKWYASWEIVSLVLRGKIYPDEQVCAATETLQNVDIYKGLYDII